MKVIASVKSKDGNLVCEHTGIFETSNTIEDIFRLAIKLTGRFSHAIDVQITSDANNVHENLKFMGSRE